LSEKSLFDVLDTEKQLLLDMARDIETKMPSISKDSHIFSQTQQSIQNPSSYNILDQDQQ